MKDPGQGSRPSPRVHSSRLGHDYPRRPYGEAERAENLRQGLRRQAAGETPAWRRKACSRPGTDRACREPLHS